MTDEPLEITPTEEGDDQQAAVGAELSVEQLEELGKLEDEDEPESDAA